MSILKGLIALTKKSTYEELYCYTNSVGIECARYLLRMPLFVGEFEAKGGLRAGFQIKGYGFEIAIGNKYVTENLSYSSWPKALYLGFMRIRLFGFANSEYAV